MKPSVKCGPSRDFVRYSQIIQHGKPHNWDVLVDVWSNICAATEKTVAAYFAAYRK